MKKEFYGWVSLGIVFLALVVAPAYLLWNESLASIGVSFWKVQFGWAVMVGVAMFVMQDKDYALESESAPRGKE